MISNQLYFSFKIIKERLVQNLWTGGIFFLTCLFTLPIYTALTLQRYIDDIANEYAKKIDAYDYLQRIIGSGNEFLKFTIIIAAIVMGCSYFSYMHSKKRVDFYHSLPLSRSRIFLSNFVAGNISFLIAYIINYILAVIVIVSMGFSNGLDFVEMFKGISLNIIFFNIIFSVTIFAGIITGTKITHALMTFVILEYIQFFFILINEYLSYFFKTFYADSIFNQKIILSLSPVTSYFTNLDKTMILFQVTSLIIILVADIYFFTIRPSETCGKSIFNKKLKNFIRYAMLTICTMAGGLVFYDVGRARFWLIFGLFFSAIVSYFIIESILNFNMGSIWKNKLKFVTFAVIFIAIFTILDMDLMNYDKRIPNLNDIESVCINPTNFDMTVDNFSDGNDISEYDRANKKLEKIKIADKRSLESVLEIADMSIKNPVNEYETDIQENYFKLVVKFNLKNGKTMTRKYAYVKKEDALPIFANIFNTNEFKYKYYPIFELKEEDLFKTNIEHFNIFKNNQEEVENKEIRSKEINKLILKSVQTDLLNIKAKDLNRAEPVAVISFYKNYKLLQNQKLESQDNQENYIQIDVPIYKEYSNTIEIIDRYFDFNDVKIDPEIVDYIEYYDYTEKHIDKNSDIVTIKEKSEIKTILENYLLNYNLYLNPFIITDQDGWAIVYLNTDRDAKKEFINVKHISIK